jgi:hypothetical protein
VFCEQEQARIQVVVIHEMGHVLGFTHEHQRLDATYLTSYTSPSQHTQAFPAYCAPEDPNNHNITQVDGWEMGAIDPKSIMSYCSDWNSNNSADGREAGAPGVARALGAQRRQQLDVLGQQHLVHRRERLHTDRRRERRQPRRPRVRHAHRPIRGQLLADLLVAVRLDHEPDHSGPIGGLFNSNGMRITPARVNTDAREDLIVYRRTYGSFTKLPIPAGFHTP